MHVSNYKATFSPIYLVFLELDTDRPYLNFQILYENNKEVIPKTFYLQLLNKQWVYTTLFNKMRVLTYKWYREDCELYTEIHGSIVINSCKIELAQKYIILLSEFSIVIYKASKRTGVENTSFIHFNLSAGIYSINDFNTKIKELVLQQSQDCEPTQIKDLKLVIPEDYTFMASNNIFIALGIQDKYLEKATLIRSTLPPGSYKTSLDTSPPMSLLLHCKQIKIELDGQPSSLLASIHVSNYKTTFSPIHLVFLELDIDQPNLDFKILDVNNNEVIPTTFYLQLLNKKWAHTTMKPKFMQI